MLCNNATLSHVAAEDSGDPMELALLRAGRLAGLDRQELLRETAEVREHAFDTVRKMMATVHHGDDGYLSRRKRCTRGGARARDARRRQRVMSGSRALLRSVPTASACSPLPSKTCHAPTVRPLRH